MGSSVIAPRAGASAGGRVGLVTGLVAEARIAGRLGAARAGGGLPAGAEAAAEALVAAGARALVSFGLCGGLAPGLAAGALVIPRAVRQGGDAFATDPALNAALGGATAETLLAADAIAPDRAAKSALHAATGAAAVDLESGAVAEVAKRHGLPFAALRAVCDPAGFTLPPAALLALDSAGEVGIARVAASVLAYPAQLPALLRLARDAGRARAALVGRVRRILDVGGLML